MFSIISLRLTKEDVILNKIKTDGIKLELIDTRQGNITVFRSC